MDAITVAGAIDAGIKLAVGAGALVKSLYEMAKNSGKTEMLGGLIELQGMMLELQSKFQVVIGENHALNEKVRTLEAILQKKQSVEPHYNAYWRRDESGGLDGPFSTKAWDQEQVLRRLDFYSFDQGRVMFRKGEEEFWADDLLSVPLGFVKENDLKHIEAMSHSPVSRRLRANHLRDPLLHCGLPER